jgi:PAS domain S-box-containing protein
MKKKPSKVINYQRDITTSKLTEEELKESEQRFKNIFENASDGILLADTKTKKFSLGNKMICRMLGYTLEEIMNMSVMDIHPAEDLPYILDVFEKQAREEIKEPVTLPVKRKDSGIFYADVSTFWLTMGGKKYMAGIFRDVTERKRIEEEKLRNEERYKKLLESITDYVYTVEIKDGQAVSTIHGPGCVAITGYTSEEYASDPYLWYRMIFDKDKEYVTERASKLILGENVRPFEHRIIHKDGSIRWVRNTPVLRYDEKGHLIAYDSMINDITERKKAEKALQESEQKYRSLFEESKDVVYISTPEGKFLDINNAGVELLGYSSKEELLQINIPQDLYDSPADRIHFQNVLLRQGFVKDFEVVFKRKDGERVNVLLTSNIVRDENGDTIAYKGIMKDITERKRLEEQLIQAQKIEAIGQLAGGIAHDFNNILTAIIGFGNLLKMETAKDSLSRSYITQILNSAERAANLTQALLTFSRKQIITPKPVNLNVIIQGVERLLSRVIGEDIELSTFLTDKILTIMADSGQIEQVLMNLATNARDAMPDGGNLIIGTELAEFSNEFTRAHGYGKPGQYALITFEDTGQGMDEKTKERIFEPFFTTKEVGKGTGLGLAMVYGIIKQHNGYINVYSELNKGTIFKIYLPLIKSAIEDLKPEDFKFLRGGEETILVAEDNVQVRELLKEILLDFGYKVVEAIDGEDAVRVFKNNKDKIQLLICDVIMPKKNGKEAYEEIKKENQNIKVIFISGYDSEIIHKKGILEKGFLFLSKPIIPDELLKKVRETLDKI